MGWGQCHGLACLLARNMAHTSICPPAPQQASNGVAVKRPGIYCKAESKFPCATTVLCAMLVVGMPGVTIRRQECFARYAAPQVAPPYSVFSDVANFTDSTQFMERAKASGELDGTYIIEEPLARGQSCDGRSPRNSLLHGLGCRWSGSRLFACAE